MVATTLGSNTSPDIFSKLSQFAQARRRSSHFFLRSRQVQQPRRERVPPAIETSCSGCQYNRKAQKLQVVNMFAGARRRDKDAPSVPARSTWSKTAQMSTCEVSTSSLWDPGIGSLETWGWHGLLGLDGIWLKHTHSHTLRSRSLLLWS